MCAQSKRIHIAYTLSAHKVERKFTREKYKYYSAIAVTCWANQTHSTLCIRNAAVINTKALAVFIYFNSHWKLLHKTLLFVELNCCLRCTVHAILLTIYVLLPTIYIIATCTLLQFRYCCVIHAILTYTKQYKIMAISVRYKCIYLCVYSRVRTQRPSGFLALYCLSQIYGVLST